MQTFRIGLMLFLGGLLSEALLAQSPRVRTVDATLPVQAGVSRLSATQKAPFRPSATARFLSSEEGRSLLQVSGHPMSKYLNQAFGVPSSVALAAARARLQQQWFMARHTALGQPEASVTPTPCDGSTGARFNLEPRANAVPQQSDAADFILNGVGEGEDLVVQTANDWRGEFASGSWDNSVTAYYVHRAASVDCSVQFEGGLPNFTKQGNEEFGVGDAAIAADATRGAFFMADVRFGTVAGIGLFRASAANLLNRTNCRDGTHQQSQATSCWTQTPPVLLNPVSQPFFGAELGLAVDERATGIGAGDVYLVASAFSTASGSGDTVFVLACTNSTLKCSSMVTLKVLGAFPYVQVRADGVVTISYLGASSFTSSPEPVMFVTCTPNGAPNPLTCSAATTVTTINNPIPTPSRGFLIDPLQGIDISVISTFPKHASRREASGSFTTFLVYDDCKNPYTPPPPPQGSATECLNSEVNMTFSTDNGATWSSPTSVDTASGHHFFPAIAADQSTGTISIVYYSTEGNRFHHDVRVLLNQISPGSTTLNPAQQITKTLVPMDTDPNSLSFFLDDFHIGAVARGTGTRGQSHLYTSFDLTGVIGTYGGKPLAEKNNHISRLMF